MCITCGCDTSHSSHHHHLQHEETKPHMVVVHHHYHGPVNVNHHYLTSDNNVDCKADAPIKPPDNHHNATKNKQQRLIEIEQHVLAKNDHIAQHNRKHFSDRKIFTLNLMSSPGSGKTTLLTETLKYLSSKYACAVIEGDQQTSNDADRIAKTGVPVIQINTGKGCHLDADMVHNAAHQLNLPENGFLFIENVGNLVCPSSFDLGENLKVVVMSVTEGDDKPLKYPHMFSASRLMIINKIDLIDHVNFDIQTCIENAKKINPCLDVITLSCVKQESLSGWFEWLEKNRCV